MRTDVWWTLDEDDYGAAGSTYEWREWTGGLFDLLPPEPTDSGSPVKEEP